MRSHHPELWVAFSVVESRRSPVDHWIDQVIPDEPGPAHAYSSLEKLAGIESHFFKGIGPKSVCGARVLAVTGMPFPTGDDPDACPECVKLVAQGVMHNKPMRQPFAEVRCQAVLKIPGDSVAARACFLHAGHDGPHREPTGRRWTRRGGSDWWRTGEESDADLVDDDDDIDW